MREAKIKELFNAAKPSGVPFCSLRYHRDSDDVVAMRQGVLEPLQTSRDEGVSVTRVGSITVVDIGPDVAALTAELARQRKSARADDQKLVLWLVVPDCRPCNGVSAALGDPADDWRLASTDALEG